MRALITMIAKCINAIIELADYFLSFKFTLVYACLNKQPIGTFVTVKFKQLEVRTATNEAWSTVSCLLGSLQICCLIIVKTLVFVCFRIHIGLNLCLIHSIFNNKSTYIRLKGKKNKKTKNKHMIKRLLVANLFLRFTLILHIAHEHA